MKLTKLTFTIAILVVCLPIIVQAKPVNVQTGNVRIIREPNGSIQVDTGNTQISVPPRSIEREINDYPSDDVEVNSSTSTQTIHNTRCGTRSVQSHQISRVHGSGQTTRQTNISTNICQ
ncbi:hypothetical protein VB715_14085 [Crocosphaera sp. UHCC 0190]|uniref:hypothetical protein n=1 Tax=Crocosphaera sp. UHCC 0190 TaxID=3110246 RepID=UPI002B1F3CBE|nr:hypothetical protein [Crocosphaera sp. UHCC 0190]MEA5510899.1 hypothetical protein [Crocosphaera sp. UHCC 0190]